MQAVLATLERGIAAILDGEEFARYLATLARFHRYSPKNVALIHAQNPDAMQVAGYRAWQALGRQVRKGERGIRIIVPYRARIALAEDDGQGEEIVTGWGVGDVWATSQTEGEPLPPPPIHGALTGDITVADVVREELVRWLHAQGVTLVRKDTGRVNGQYLPYAREIAIHRDLMGLRELKTLVHEAAHCAADHYGGVRREDAETVAEGRRTRCSPMSASTPAATVSATWRIGHATWRWCGATSGRSTRWRIPSSPPSRGTIRNGKGRRDWRKGGGRGGDPAPARPLARRRRRWRCTR
jgi:hypothetical protein